MAVVKFKDSNGNWVVADNNAVQYTAQTLTDEQKAQARANIGVSESTGGSTGLSKYIREATYALTSADVGYNLNILYAIRNETISINLTQENSANIPSGSIITITRTWGSSVTLNTSGVRIGVAGKLNNGIAGLTTSAAQSFPITEPFGVLVLQKIENGGSSGDVWMLREEATTNYAAPKASPTFTGTATFNSMIKLNSSSYGTTLPAAGNAGRIFFKKA